MINLTTQALLVTKQIIHEFAWEDCDYYFEAVPKWGFAIALSPIIFLLILLLSLKEKLRIREPLQ